MAAEQGERPESPTDESIIHEGERIASIALDKGLAQRPNTDDVTRITFGTILTQLSLTLLEVPETDRPGRRKKLMRVLENKFNEQLASSNKRPSIEESEKKLLINLVSSKIACWIEGILDETELRMAKERALANQAEKGEKNIEETKDDEVVETPVEKGESMKSDVYQVKQESKGSGLQVENLAKKQPTKERGTMTESSEAVHVWEFLQGPGNELGTRTSVEVRNWLQWISGVMAMTEDWATWINKTVASAEEKAAKKRGEIYSSPGCAAKLTRQEWCSWTDRISKDAKNFTTNNRNVQKTAVEWRKWFDNLSKTKEGDSAITQ